MSGPVRAQYPRGTPRVPTDLAAPGCTQIAKVLGAWVSTVSWSSALAAVTVLRTVNTSRLSDLVTSCGAIGAERFSKLMLLSSRCLHQRLDTPCAATCCTFLFLDHFYFRQQIPADKPIYLHLYACCSSTLL